MAKKISGQDPRLLSATNYFPDFTQSLASSQQLLRNCLWMGKSVEWCWGDRVWAEAGLAGQTAGEMCAKPAVSSVAGLPTYTQTRDTGA